MWVDQYLIKARAGGAILSTKSSVTIIESVFEGNSAEAGGAIFCTLQASITIINSISDIHISTNCMHNSTTLCIVVYEFAVTDGNLLNVP